jgi:hypothetical protein
MGKSQRKMAAGVAECMSLIVAKSQELNGDTPFGNAINAVARGRLRRHWMFGRGGCF